MSETTAARDLADVAPDVTQARDALARHCESELDRVLVALVHGEVVGAVALCIRWLSPLSSERTVIANNLHVQKAHRGKFVASTLLSVAARWGEENDCDVMFTTSSVTSRDANRFLSKVGFQQALTVRGASIGSLQARFAGIATSSKDTGRLIAVRRHMRRRQAASSLRPTAAR